MIKFTDVNIMAEIPIHSSNLKKFLNLDSVILMFIYKKGSELTLSLNKVLNRTALTIAEQREDEVKAKHIQILTLKLYFRLLEENIGRFRTKHCIHE